MDNTTSTGQPATLYTAVADEIKAELKETFRQFVFTYDKTVGKGSLSFQSSYRNKTYKGNIYFTAETPADNKVKFTFDGTYDKGAKYYYENIVALKQLVELLQSTTWTLQSASRIAPATMQLVSQANAGDVLVVNVQ